ncbi:DNA polymerase III subunit beta [Candidatus Kuenenbacteria bacterium HGW-Kuenenbacteria-1]|uniref:Beta sliding clamp n=1 Tax=Candidatus Kuenenbacteria bacterium HGW-Kuenenbacteria-1 TaxID=2013812 RepID=A0A2N1UMT3_9BACT|nr:MAG: DNA polymerase III subunit beta [Candidatus Kuenenbacteria bacterium HGW-Kuenenbacteria-1]
MKFTCLQENLNKGLFLVSHIALKNSYLPILNNVLIQIKNNTIELITSNLEIGIKCQIRGKTKEEGKFIIPCQFLVNYIALLPKQPIEIEIKNSKMFLECDNQKMQINKIAFAEFPTLPELKNKIQYNLKIIDFKKALEQIISAITFNELRPEISGALLNFNSQPNWLTIAGTDSFQIAEKKISFQENSADLIKQIIIPFKTCQELLRILPEEENEIIKICIDTNQICFSFQNIELISRTIEGKFPDYPQIIPKEYKTKVLLDVGELIKGIKRQSLFIPNKKREISLKFSSVDQEIIIFSNSVIGESISKIKGDIKGEDNEIVLDYKYLLNGVQSLKSDKVILEIFNKKQPLILKSPMEEKNLFYFIFPLKEKE